MNSHNIERAIGCMDINMQAVRGGGAWGPGDSGLFGCLFFVIVGVVALVMYLERSVPEGRAVEPVASPANLGERASPLLLEPDRAEPTSPPEIVETIRPTPSDPPVTLASSGAEWFVLSSETHQCEKAPYDPEFQIALMRRVGDRPEISVAKRDGEITEVTIVSEKRGQAWMFYPSRSRCEEAR